MVHSVLTLRRYSDPSVSSRVELNNNEQENMITRRRKDVECAIEAKCGLFYRDMMKGQEMEGGGRHTAVDFTK
ncbi:hypothetical protein APICC_00578 [Apis cerana cerana]|uniref:Uncharacterized protein n=1 Tax=Apis cerana cerana TaxID=94128 RepID=A0A2A3EAJ3_APICC|nr:hypothetical protein APICC_00578 [Apis cerana cerana]